jgi:hypothetical protein
VPERSHDDILPAEYALTADDEFAVAERHRMASSGAPFARFAFSCVGVVLLLGESRRFVPRGLEPDPRRMVRLRQRLRLVRGRGGKGHLQGSVRWASWVTSSAEAQFDGACQRP